MFLYLIDHDVDMAQHINEVGGRGDAFICLPLYALLAMVSMSVADRAAQ